MAANTIVVNDSYSTQSKTQAQAGTTDPLCSWVVARVDQWQTYRNETFKDKWDQYYRIWRGLWKAEDKTRDSERSRLISPATAQAVESTVAELEGALFDRKMWVNVEDDKTDPDKSDMKFITAMLDEFEINAVPQAISQVLLLGALYGTGIGKIITSTRTIRTPQQMGGTLTAKEEEEVAVLLEPVEPNQFCIDPVARTIEEALGVAHIIYVPTHQIYKNMRGDDPMYKEMNIGAGSADTDWQAKGEPEPRNMSDYAKITEYHGLVPKRLFDQYNGEEETKDPVIVKSAQTSEQSADALDADDELVEVIVTVANDAFCLRAIKNPNFMGDRNFIAYQHEMVPNRFWGMGVCEKGYSSQKALDAELRARMDSLAFALNPMMAINAGSLPRTLNEKIKVFPGKTFITQGPVGDAVQAVNFQPPPLQSFQQTADLERMVEMATGAIQGSSPLRVNPRNTTASGMSMIHSGFIKRSRRVLKNLERNFLVPFVKKASYRYMQVDPERFPLNDHKFKVYSTLGVVAREFEQQQLTNLLGMVPPESPAFWMILKSLFSNSNTTDREEVLPMIDQMMKNAMQPKPPSMDEMVKAAKVENDKMRANSDKLSKLAGAVLALAKASDLGNQSVLDELQLIQEMQTNAQEQAESAGGGEVQNAGGTVRV